MAASVAPTDRLPESAAQEMRRAAPDWRSHAARRYAVARATHARLNDPDWSFARAAAGRIDSLAGHPPSRSPVRVCLDGPIVAPDYQESIRGQSAGIVSAAE